jgi:hypothetical protein
MASHRVVVQALNRWIQYGPRKFYYGVDNFRGSEPDWDSVPVIYATKHPDHRLVKADLAAALRSVDGRLVGRMRDSQVIAEGTPRMESVVDFDDPQAEADYGAGHIGLSSAFVSNHDDDGRLNEVVRPNHLLVFPQGDVNLQRDPGAMFLNKREGNDVSIFTRAVEVLHRASEMAFGNANPYHDERGRFAEGDSGGSSGVGLSRGRVIPANEPAEDIAKDNPTQGSRQVVQAGEKEPVSSQEGGFLYPLTNVASGTTVNEPVKGHSASRWANLTPSQRIKEFSDVTQGAEASGGMAVPDTNRPGYHIGQNGMHGHVTRFGGDYGEVSNVWQSTHYETGETKNFRDVESATNHAMSGKIRVGARLMDDSTPGTPSDGGVKRMLGYKHQSEDLANADYPWDTCIEDQLKKGYSDEQAKRICGAIKAKNNMVEMRADDTSAGSASDGGNMGDLDKIKSELDAANAKLATQAQELEAKNKALEAASADLKAGSDKLAVFEQGQRDAAWANMKTSHVPKGWLAAPDEAAKTAKETELRQSFEKDPIGFANKILEHVKTHPAGDKSVQEGAQFENQAGAGEAQTAARELRALSGR